MNPRTPAITSVAQAALLLALAATPAADAVAAGHTHPSVTPALPRLVAGAATAPQAWAPNYPGANGLPAVSAAARASALPFPAAGDAWVEQKTIAEDGATDDLYGFRVLIAGDTAFVSAPAPLYHSGKVYVYRLVGPYWTQVQEISATPPDANTPPNWSDFFGWSLSLSGDTLFVGAPEAFNTMYGPAGGAFVFTRGDDDTWMQAQALTSPSPQTLTWFGRAVVVRGDLAVVGETAYQLSSEGGRGAAHAFARQGNVWTETQLLQGSDSENNDDRDFGAAIVADDDYVLIGAPGPDFASDNEYPTGEVYVFSNTGGTLAEIQHFSAGDGAPGDQFGYALALSGTQLLVGAPAANVGVNAHQGAGYVFDRSGGSYAQVQKLVADDGQAYDQMGQAVALQAGLAALGMWSFNDEPGGTPPPARTGVVRLFSASNGGWNLEQELAASDGSDGNSFGWDVAIDGSTLLVGADADSSVAAYQGSAYFYTRDTLFRDGFDGVP